MGKMSLEGFSKRGMELGDDPEGISEGPFVEKDIKTDDIEKQNRLDMKDIKTDDIEKQIRYKLKIEKMALLKRRNELQFESKLNEIISEFSDIGKTREDILNDINDLSDLLDLQDSIDALDHILEETKNNLGSIFGM